MKHYLKKLEEQVHLRADKPALCDYQGASYTYAQMAAYIEQMHIFFQAAGIRKGDKISLVARNSARWALNFLAVNNSTWANSNNHCLLWLLLCSTSQNNT